MSWHVDHQFLLFLCGCLRYSQCFLWFHFHLFQVSNDFHVLESCIFSTEDGFVSLQGPNDIRSSNDSDLSSNRVDDSIQVTSSRCAESHKRCVSLCGEKKHFLNIRVFPKIWENPPKSSILIGFSIINHPFWGTLIIGNTHNSLENNTNTVDGEGLRSFWDQTSLKGCWVTNNL